MASDTANTTVAAVQMRSIPCDVTGNLAKAAAFLERVSRDGAKLTLHVDARPSAATWTRPEGIASSPRLNEPRIKRAA